MDWTEIDQLKVIAYHLKSEGIQDGCNTKKLEESIEYFAIVIEKYDKYISEISKKAPMIALVFKMNVEHLYYEKKVTESIFYEIVEDVVGAISEYEQALNHINQAIELAETCYKHFNREREYEMCSAISTDKERWEDFSQEAKVQLEYLHMSSVV
ncbi:hypothetical protein GLW05_11855 [Pontibacillus yanchengensis]|uniref:Uncharacterized protein n=1 Tax=Pontibacillus yanchengensis TaxID=462910 RepID=A0A6I5A1K8_9BACI|nr:hypothetical protein [Pontibacillus yanchengensis]MYL34292.1 hypothetical protein [Pontibacillus yanchengensis]